MKSLGIVRKVDELGRIVLPIELRRTLGLDTKDMLEIYVDADSIVLKRFNNACILCGSPEDVFEFKDKAVCSKCAKQLGTVG